MMYYNEINKQKAYALQELMNDGFIPKGDIDTRSIADVMPSDLVGYHQWHFFAGIGLWTRALYLAGYGNVKGIATGSCPCQPFSTAGAQLAQADERHLYPEWRRLIGECGFPVVIGEQVASSIALGWLDGVADDLETKKYAVWPAVLPACSVRKPHKRDRLYIVAVTHGILEHAAGYGSLRSEIARIHAAAYVDSPEGEKSAGQSQRTGGAGDVAHTGSAERRTHPKRRRNESHRADARWEEAASRSELHRALALAYASSPGPEGWQRGMDGAGRAEFIQRSEEILEWIECPDGKYRSVKPGISLLVNGYTERVGLLHAAGDGIVPSVAAEAIRAGLSHFQPTLEGELYAYR